VLKDFITNITNFFSYKKKKLSSFFDFRGLRPRILSLTHFICYFEVDDIICRYLFCLWSGRISEISCAAIVTEEISKDVIVEDSSRNRI
jgi:hypothetical protein